jgi:hypothetical protein
MTEDHADDRLKQQCIARMGQTLGEIFDELCREVDMLHLKFNQFEALYTNENTVQLLNKSSSEFFSLIQTVLWKDIVLHIARLTDKRSKGNLTVDTLVKMLDKQTRSFLHGIIETVKQASRFAHDLRNKRLAHLDFEIATNHSAQPLPANLKIRIRSKRCRIS